MTGFVKEFLERIKNKNLTFSILEEGKSDEPLGSSEKSVMSDKSIKGKTPGSQANDGKESRS